MGFTSQEHQLCQRGHRAPCACSPPSGEGSRVPRQAPSTGWSGGMNPSCVNHPCPKIRSPPVQKEELHWGRALGEERRTLGMKAGAGQGCAQLWQLMCCWIPSPVSAALSEPQERSGCCRGCPGCSAHRNAPFPARERLESGQIAAYHR